MRPPKLCRAQACFGSPRAASFSSSSDELPGRRFEYRYDNAGNRTSSGETGSTQSGDDAYTTNNLNQYTSRQNNTVRVLGTASPGTSTPYPEAQPGDVSVAGATADQLDRNFAADIVPDNATGPAQGTVTVTATLPGTGISKSIDRNYFVPAQTQALSYDADGNMTSDGVWNYTYDAENRLIRMQSVLPSTFASTGTELDFTYDYLNRRVEKKVFQNSQLNFDRRYVYAGNNLVAEYTVGSTLSLVRTYTWGLDLTGSLSAAGGVGALLQISNVNSDGSTTDYFPTTDGDGNIVSLVRSDGSLAAAYDYSPFGELLRDHAYDKAIADNPFKFSSKFTDSETGLVYYGHRYYSPGLGRFINRDPIEEAGGLNLYGFCGNDPINDCDVMGNSWLSSLWDRTILSLGRKIAINWDHSGREVAEVIGAAVLGVLTGGAA